MSRLTIVPCLALLMTVFIGCPELVYAQSDTSKPALEKKPTANSDSAQGRLQLRFKKSGVPPQDWIFTDFKVVLLRIGTTWTIVGTAGDRRLDITLDEGAKTLKFILGDYVWNLQTTSPKISITTSADRPEILIRFVGNIEATGHTGRHYNLMSGSLLAVKAN